jgi:hypothetical protein
MLQQFPRDMGNNNLIITQYDANIRITGNFENTINNTYVIRNEGEECAATIGIAFYTDRDDNNFVPKAIKFFANGVLKTHRIEYNKLNIPAWPYDECLVMIDVIFPHGEEVAIELSYQDSKWDVLMDKSGISFGSYESNWGSIAPLSMTIENDSNDEVWISDIDMETLTGSNNFYFSVYRTLMASQHLNVFKFYKRYTASDPLFCDFIIVNENKINILLTDSFDRITKIITSYNRGSIGTWRRFVLSEEKIYSDKLSLHSLSLLTANQLRIVRNAIYAKYGYVFQDRNLQQLFETIPFRQIRNIVSDVFDDSLITEVDRANIETIRQMEMIKRRTALGDYFEVE